MFRNSGAITPITELSTVKRTREVVSNKAVDLLRTKITSGFYKPGERLKETDLAGKLEMSRSAIREALKALEGEGLVQHIPNKGFIVSNVTFIDARDIYETREVLEGLASRLFAERALADQVAKLKQALDDFEAAAKSFQKNPQQKDLLLEPKNRFYDVLLEGSGNMVIESFLKSLRDRISWLRVRTLSHPGRPMQTLAELRAIFNAIESKNPKAAEEASRLHIHEAAKVAYSELLKRPNSL